MELLRLVTLIYAAVLVAALAVSLTAILVYLRRITAALGEVRDALDRVCGETEGFEAALASLEQTVHDASLAFREAETDFDAAEDQLKDLAARRGLFAPQS